jgi:hypothetical protein
MAYDTQYSVQTILNRVFDETNNRINAISSAPDDVLVPFGDDGDVNMVLRSTALAADAELAGVIVGTSDHPGVAANSLIIGDITADGDIMLAVQSGGNTTKTLLMDASGGRMLLGGLDIIIQDGKGIVVGHNTIVAAAGRIPEVEFHGTGNADTTVGLYRWDASSDSATFVFAKSRGALGTLGTTVVSGDNLGTLTFVGDDGSDLVTTAANISVECTGTIASNKIPGVLKVTTADANGTLRAALTLDSTQVLTVAGNVHTIGPTGVVFNEQGADIDFRVEGDSISTLFSIDAGLDAIGIGVDPAGDAWLRFGSRTTPANAGSSSFILFNATLTGAGSSQVTLQLFCADGGINLGADSATYTDIAMVKLDEPNVTKNTGSATAAATLLLTGFVTEATNNYRINSKAATAVWAAGATDVFDAAFFTTTHTATSGRTLVNVATLYVEGAPDVSDAEITATNGPYAAWFDAGEVRIDGALTMNGALNHDGSTAGFYAVAPVSRATTSIAEATFVANAGGTAVNVDSTFDGYTIQQVAQALQSIGILT